MNGVPFPTRLPAKGMLYFFYQADEQEVWGEKEHKDGWRVLYYDGDLDALESAVSPTDDYFTLNPCRIHFVATKVLDAEAFEGTVEIPDEREDAYYAFLDDLYESISAHQAFGQPFPIQNDVFEECEWHSGQTDKEWILLLQVDSDEDNLDIMWGDAGMIYFCIPKNALAQQKFEESWMIYQCH